MAVIAIVSRILASHVKPTRTWLNWLALSYLISLALAICVLLFLCGDVAIAQHSEWFNA